MPPRQTPEDEQGRTSSDVPTFEDIEILPPDEGNLPVPFGGVTPDYRASRPVDYSQAGAYAHGFSYSDTTRTPAGSQEPTFYEGAEYRYYGAPPADIARLQRLLTEAGLLDPDTYQPGFIGGAGDDPTIAAIRTVMGYANRAGFTTVEDAVRSYIQSGYGAIGSRGYNRNQVRLPAPVQNADDLRRVFRAVVIDTLGQGWSEGQIDAMVDNYQAAERRFNASAAAGEPIDEQMATPETFAEQFAANTDPGAAQAHEFVGVAQRFRELLGGWGQ